MNLAKAETHLKKDPVLKLIIDRIPFELPLSNGDVYFYLIRSIVYQQLSGKAAGTIFNRFLQLFDDAYPYPESLMEFQVEDLREVGLSRQKSTYIQNVADFFQQHQLEHKDWNTMSDDDIIAFLTQIKGVGAWTVQMMLMTTLQRPDVFPVDDLGIQKAMQKWYQIEAENRRTLKKQMHVIAKTWQPYRTIASFYLWRSLDS